MGLMLRLNNWGDDHRVDIGHRDLSEEKENGARL